MKICKKIFAVLFATMLIFPIHSVEAGFLNELVGFIEDMQTDPQEAAERQSDQILKALWKSAVLMEEAKLCLAEALNFDPQSIAASRAVLQAMTVDRNDLNAIRNSTYHPISEDELRVKAAILLSEDDQSRYAQISKLLQKSKVARSAAHAYNADAVGHVTQALIHVKRIARHNRAGAADYLGDRIQEAEKLLALQNKQSEMFHEVLEEVERKWNITEPTSSEVEKIEREILPE